jgi:hypothetical protein
MLSYYNLRLSRIISLITAQSFRRRAIRVKPPAYARSPLAILYGLYNQASLAQPLSRTWGMIVVNQVAQFVYYDVINNTIGSHDNRLVKVYIPSALQLPQRLLKDLMLNIGQSLGRCD